MTQRGARMQTLRVRIAKAPAGAWYAGYIGWEFEVCEDQCDYILKEDCDERFRRHIRLDDCEVIDAGVTPA